MHSFVSVRVSFLSVYLTSINKQKEKKMMPFIDKTLASFWIAKLG